MGASILPAARIAADIDAPWAGIFPECCRKSSALDEPNHHLDLAAIEEPEKALNGFDGTLIVASDDLIFLRAIGIAREIAAWFFICA